tara:strand:+ start:218 stop:430 length:213 start_codon:yes stop_codon:yes gene_type:complete
MINSSKNHLKDSKESYFEHMGIALKISIKLISGGFMAFAHSLIPGIFTKNASTMVINLSKEFEERKKRQK